MTLIGTLKLYIWFLLTFYSLAFLIVIALFVTRFIHLRGRRNFIVLRRLDILMPWNIQRGGETVLMQLSKQPTMRVTETGSGEVSETESSGESI